MPCSVAHVREYSGPLEQTIYIGRSRYVDGWGNRHLVGSCSATGCYGKLHTRSEAIALYEQELLANPRQLAKLPELKNKVLLCWCKPAACHGDVLARLVNDLDV